VKQAKDKIRLAAEACAKDLFTNGMGQVAQRLVLELTNDQCGGGWGQGPLADAIERRLRETLYLKEQPWQSK
jgi:hypothetical protein